MVARLWIGLAALIGLSGVFSHSIVGAVLTFAMAGIGYFLWREFNKSKALLTASETELKATHAELEQVRNQLAESIEVCAAQQEEALLMSDSLHHAQSQCADIEGQLRILRDNEAIRAQQQGEILESLASQIMLSIDEAERAIAAAIQAFMEVNEEAQSLTKVAAGSLDQSEQNSSHHTITLATEVMNNFVGHMLVTATEIADAALQMQSLVEITKRLNGLLDQIEDVAAQTSLLSLNASIEAARAGDAGRGFAVVATEVRNLSDRCKKAAEETRDLTVSITQSTTTICQKLGQSATQSRDEGCGAQGELIQLLARIREADQENQAIVGELSARSQAIGRNLGQVILAFQFQDLLRQRLEHVAAPLGHMRDELLTSAGLDVPERIYVLPVAPGATPDLTVVTYDANDDNIELFG